MNTFIKFFWIFISGCFLGSVLETIWCLIKNRKLEKRKDLIYGYFTSMYGIAGLIIALIVEVFSFENLFVIFVISFCVSGVVEYVTSFFQEKSMGVLFWDYSKMWLNLHGRVNLIYLLAFGLIGVFWCKGYPVLLSCLEKLMGNDNIIMVVSIVLCLFMIFNFFISFVVGVRQKYRRKGIFAKNRLEIWLDNKYTDEYMARIFPNLIFIEKKPVLICEKVDFS